MAGGMLKRSILLAVSALLILISSGVGCASFGEEPRLSVCSSSASVTITGNVVSEGPPPVGPIPNPAAAYCVAEGYTHEIRTDPDTGAQTGYCVFSSATECEEWNFFRGSCSPPPVPNGAGGSDLSEPGYLDEGADDGTDDGDGTEGGDGEDDEALTPVEAAAAKKNMIELEMEPLLEKEATGTLTSGEAATLAEKRLELLDAEIALLDAEIEALAEEMALSDIEEKMLALEGEKLALALETKEIEKRALLGEAEEGDALRLAEIENLILIIDLKQEALEIEERALTGSSWPEDEERQEELNAAIAYLEAEMDVGAKGAGGEED